MPARGPRKSLAIVVGQRRASALLPVVMVHGPSPYRKIASEVVGFLAFAAVSGAFVIKRRSV